MTIPAAPTVPVPTSSTFAADAYAFTQWQATLGPAIDAETQRLNELGFGSYSATSTTSLTIGTGSKSLTVEAGKGYAVGQAVMIASTAGPTNYMAGQVTSYNSSTGALVVNVTAVAGSGTVAAWTVSVAAVVAGGGVSPDSIVVLTSGTSWTCPTGVTRAFITVVGGGGGSGAQVGGGRPGAGGGAGFAKSLLITTPGIAYAYTIGAGGAASTTGGSTTFTNGGAVLTGGGGNPGGNSETGGNGGGAGGKGGVGSGGAINGSGGSGESGSFASNTYSAAGGCSVLGVSGGSQDSPGIAGKIVLELYK